MRSEPTTPACQTRTNSGLTWASFNRSVPRAKAMCAATAIATPQISRRERLERFLDDGNEETDKEQRAGADPRVPKRVADAGIWVVDGPLDQCQNQSDRRAAADGESKDRRGLVSIDLRLVQIDQVEDGDQKCRDENRRGDEPRDVQDEDAGETGRESPAELVDLVLSEMRKERRENGRLDDVLIRVSRISVLAFLGVADLRCRPLMCTATGAEHAVGNVVCAVVATHGP